MREQVLLHTTSIHYVVMLARSISRCAVDKYSKGFSAVQVSHLLLFVFAAECHILASWVETKEVDCGVLLAVS